MSEILTFAQAASLRGEDFRIHHLSDLLRDARARAPVAPELVEESADSGGVGITQAQTARLIGLSERGYREFERGRLVHPDPRLLDHVARVLHLDAAERKILYGLAVRDIPRPRTESDLDISGLQSMVDALEFPAIVTDLGWDYLAWNKAVTDYLLDPAGEPKETRNAILLGFGPIGAARWPSELANLRNLVGRARAAYIAEGGRSPALQGLVERLVAIPEAAAHWQTGPLALEPAYEPRTLAHPRRGPLQVRVIRTVLPQGVRISQFIPDPQPA